ncbi:MAG: class I SAM-dependent methyltransferase [Acidobacteria bacterium]|nr:class I SAM-dependent methyltransferase [Acidobacteriota bacterium]
MRILDAGCGGGRNLVYLLRQGYEVFGVDAEAEAVRHARQLAASLAPDLPGANFQVAPVESLPWNDNFADVVISSAVLHFAANEVQFDAMVREMWRVLRGGGLLFCRLASNIGLERQVVPLGGRRYRLPDGSDRFLVDEAILARYTAELGGRMEDPLKTTVVQNQRSMTTWVLRKPE